MDQHGETGRALDERPDRGALEADQQVTFPVSGEAARSSARDRAQGGPQLQRRVPSMAANGLWDSVLVEQLRRASMYRQLRLGLTDRFRAAPSSNTVQLGLQGCSLAALRV